MRSFFSAFLFIQLITATKVTIEVQADENEIKDFLNKSIRNSPLISEAVYLECSRTAVEEKDSFEKVTDDTLLDAMVWSYGLNVCPTARFNFLFKPVEFHLMGGAMAMNLALTVNSFNSEAFLKSQEHQRVYDKLKKIGIFVREARKHKKKVEFVVPESVKHDDEVKYLLKHFYGRRSLSFAAPSFENEDFEWLQEVDASILAHHHELLDAMKDFSIFSPETITLAVKGGYNFCSNKHAMETMTPTALATIVKEKGFFLSLEEFVAILNAKNFRKMLESDPLAWQCFTLTPAFSELYKDFETVYSTKVKPLLTLSDESVICALLSSFVHSEAIINSSLTFIAFNVRLGLLNEQQLEFPLSNLKKGFQLRRNIMADLKDAGMTALLGLFETSTLYAVRQAFLDFDASAQVPDNQIASVLIQRIQSAPIAEPTTDQIRNYKIILECFDASVLPYNLDAEHSATQIIQNLMRATKLSTATHMSKAILCNLAFDAFMTNSVNEEFSNQLLGALSLMPLHVFMQPDVEMLKTNYGQVLGFSEVIEAMEKQLANPFGLAFPVLPYFEKLESLLAAFKELEQDPSSLQKFTETEVLIECTVSQALRAVKKEDLLFVWSEHPLLLEAVNLVPQTLNREIILFLLGSADGIQFLRSNPRILHGLRNYEDLTLEHVKALQESLNLERIGVGLPTFPAPFLLFLLARRNYFLHEPEKFIWRLHPALWSLSEFQLLFIKSMNLATIAWSPRMANDANFAFYAVNFAESISTHPDHSFILKTTLTWHIMQEMRFLECFGYLLQIMSSDDETILKDYEIARDLVLTSFVTVSVAEVDELRKLHILVQRMSTADDVSKPNRAFAGRIMKLLEQPLSSVRARVLAYANGISTDYLPILSFFSSCNSFRLMFPKFIENLGRLFSKSDESKLYTYLNRKMAVERQNCLKLVQELFTGKELALMEARIQAFAVMEADLENYNLDYVKALSSGILPYWERKVITRLVKSSLSVESAIESK